MQKVYTVDFLTKKKKVNRGEVPQYYVEGSHQAIISPPVFDEVQRQMAARHSGKNRAGCASPFSSRIKCADCGSWYGPKVWHSNSRYRKVIWQCNHKFDGGVKCSTPHLDEETVKALFLKAVNAVFDERDGILEDYETVRDTLYGISDLEAERLQLQEERNVVAELMEQNAGAAFSQAEHREKYDTAVVLSDAPHNGFSQAEHKEKYDRLSERFNGIQARLEEICQSVTERQKKREEIMRFVFSLKDREDLLAEFYEDDWYSLVDHVMVYSREDVGISFKNGREVRF